MTGENGIASRHLAVESLEDAFVLTPDALHTRFARHAPELAAQVAERALATGQLASMEVDAIIISTCTGYLCPGLTSHVSERLGLRSDVVALHWSVESAPTEVFAWLEQSSPAADVMLANLFLHHFPDDLLTALLQLAAAKTNLFMACEPRRSLLALAAARRLRLIGCNDIAQHDAVLSVRAGFLGRELSVLWPTDNEWKVSEQPAGLFSHCFIAKRHA